MLNGKDIPLGEAASGLPDVGGGVQMILQPVKIGLITKTQVDGLVQESTTWQDAKVSKQPFSAQQLIIRPEGQRAWRWYTVHATPDLDLGVDDVFILAGVRYRVMEKYGYQEYGFVQYNCIEDYVSA